MSFPPFTLDCDTRQLTRAGAEVHLSRKAFDLLTILVAERPAVMSKAVLQGRLWPDTFVAEANLSNLVTELRRALGDHGRPPLHIRTAHGVGYAFCADAVPVADSSRTLDATPTAWLEWNRKRFPLTAGEHVLGRDPDVQIRLDAATVSRRHARLLVSEEATVLEDFGSKNGTYRGNDRVSAPVQLADGDAIRIGALLLTFHTVSRAGSTATMASSDITPP